MLLVSSHLEEVLLQEVEVVVVDLVAAVEEEEAAAAEVEVLVLEVGHLLVLVVTDHLEEEEEEEGRGLLEDSWQKPCVAWLGKPVAMPQQQPIPDVPILWELILLLLGRLLIQLDLVRLQQQQKLLP